MGMVMLAPGERDCAGIPVNNQNVMDAIISDVAVLSPIATIQEADYILSKTGCNYIVVFDGREPRGMLSRLQFERYAERQQGRAPILLLRDVMLPIPFRARTYDRLVTVRERMTQSGFSWLPILDERGKLAGVLLSL
jgi:CBS domain-containing protein